MDVSSFYTQLIGIGALMVGSAFFSSSETALMASSKPKLHTYEKQGKKAAKRVANMLEDPEKLLATLLLGNNLVNIAASALATKVMLDMFGAAGLAYATLGMTFLVTVFDDSTEPADCAAWGDDPSYYDADCSDADLDDPEEDEVVEDGEERGASGEEGREAHDEGY